MGLRISGTLVHFSPNFLVRWKDRMKTTKERIDRAMEIRDELFQLANSFAGDETGHVAMELHQSVNCISRAKLLIDKMEKE